MGVLDEANRIVENKLLKDIIRANGIFFALLSKTGRYTLKECVTMFANECIEILNERGKTPEEIKQILSELEEDLKDEIKRKNKENK